MASHGIPIRVIELLSRVVMDVLMIVLLHGGWPAVGLPSLFGHYFVLTDHDVRHDFLAQLLEGLSLFKILWVGI